ncbi:TetR/AcrR family transcriptional regulator [Cytobacillus sp. FJAT-53684]|uniref:TetR/AcrR family transcriptional regulator n=1 Tax=Cytobacillus mangrovibacter TaxID=3299024 RepID=A0ABW6JY14_9BACI
MATAFTESEKELIRDKLKHVARQYLSQYGVKKTTVDQLVQLTGISKGAFYMFYPSKEILFFTVLEDYQEQLMAEFAEKLKKMTEIRKGIFAALLVELFQEVRHSFLMTIIKNQEFENLVRKLPQDMIMNHHSFDNVLAQTVFSYVKLKKEFSIEVAAASLRAIFMSLLHVKEIGEKEFDEVLKLLIHSAIHQLIEEDGHEGNY